MNRIFVGRLNLFCVMLSGALRWFRWVWKSANSDEMNYDGEDIVQHVAGEASARTSRVDSPSESYSWDQLKLSAGWWW